MHLLKWGEVIKPKRSRGLGLSSLEDRNAALLAKWWWRFGGEMEALWRKVIFAKYSEDKWGWWPPNPGPRHRRSGLWGVIA